MVETSTKIRNKQKQIWRKILMFQLYCSHLNLVLPLAVMQNINIMCMHKANSMCLWYSGYNSWIYWWPQSALSSLFSCHVLATTCCYALTDSWIPFIVVTFRNVLYNSTAGSSTASLKMFSFHCSQSTYTHLQQIILCYKIPQVWDKKHLEVDQCQETRKLN